MRSENELAKRLRDGGWVKEREGRGHGIWRHPNGNTFALPRRVTDSGRDKTNYLKQIERLEKS